MLTSVFPRYLKMELQASLDNLAFDCAFLDGNADSVVAAFSCSEWFHQSLKAGNAMFEMSNPNVTFGNIFETPLHHVYYISHIDMHCFKQVVSYPCLLLHSHFNCETHGFIALQLSY